MYKVTVTDPEDATINCNDVKVTFVLGHDTHGHAEAAARPVASASCRPTRRTSSHGGNVFGVISAQLHRQGRHGARAADRRPRQNQIRQKPPGGRERRHPVGDEHRDQRPTARRASARIAAAWRPVTGCSSTARTTCTRSTRSRSAWPTRPGREPAGPRRRFAAGGGRGPSGLGDHRADRGDLPAGLHRQHGRVGLDEPDVPARGSAGQLRQARAVPRVPHGARAVPPAATCST